MIIIIEAKSKLDLEILEIGDNLVCYNLEF